ncbi:hypothetical protein HDU84_003475 [Entophlyctis sp. JEL0112]|nr:hypothetical protein HDU84_003475 [Entophlyctis sp. JEL0112]
MSDLRQRATKTKTPPTSPAATETSEETAPMSLKAQKKSMWSVATLVVSIVPLLLAASFLTTNTMTFGVDPHGLTRRIFPRQPRVFTTAELKEFDGSDPSKPIYVAISGKVYDVSAGEKYYGKGGGYSFFAGVDATRAYITGCFQTHLTHDLRGLTEEQLKTDLSHWTDFYEKHEKYFYVGEVKHDPIPDDQPIPEPPMFLSSPQMQQLTDNLGSMSHVRPMLQVQTNGSMKPMPVSNRNNRLMRNLCSKWVNFVNLNGLAGKAEEVLRFNFVNNVDLTICGNMALSNSYNPF